MNTSITAVVSEQDLRRLEAIDKVLEVLEKQVDAVIKERDEYKVAYEKAVDVAIKKSVTFENMKRREESLRIMLGQACDEMEGIFRSTKGFASVEIAREYTVWASYLKHNYGRDDAGCIDDANDWIDKL